MDLTRFQACAEAYGAARRRWPPHEQRLYDRFAGTPEGLAILAQAQLTDGFLDAWEVREPGAALAQKIAGIPSSEGQEREARVVAIGVHQPQRVGRGPGFWLKAAALAASATIGFALGFAQVPDDASADVVTQLVLGLKSIWMTGL